jgi:hypothetical protein
MVLRVNPQLQALRAAFRLSPLRSAMIEDVLPAEVLAVLRARVAPALRPFYVADRGRFHLNEEHVEPGVASVLSEVASSVAGVELVAGSPRWQRFVRGDYALYKDDAARWRGRTETHELIVDLSAQGSPEAQVVYFDGESGVVFPQRPGLLGLVERRPGVQRYDRYLTHRSGAAEVFRLSLPLSSR